MAINERKTEVVRAFLGQKSGQPLESYGFDSGTNITGFTPKEGQLQRVSGGNIYAEILPSELGGITSIHRFKNLWMAQRGTVMVAEDSEASTTFTNIFTDLSSNKAYSAQWRDRIFFTNRVDAKFLLNRSNNELDTLRKIGNLGMDPPTWEGFPYDTATPPFEITASGGGGNVGGPYVFYVMTLLDSETNSESPGWGALTSADGLYELTFIQGQTLDNFNKFINVLNPKAIIVAALADIMTFNLAQMVAYLQDQLLLNTRATHFCIYRSTSTDGLNPDDSFKRVPLVNASSSQDGNYIIDIAEFISDNQAFIDNTAEASLPAVLLPTNNSPPPTIERFRRAFQYMKDFNNPALEANGIVEGDFDESKYSGFRHIRLFRDQLFGIGARSEGFVLKEGLDLPEFFPPVLNPFADILFGSEVYQPDYFPYIWEVGRGDGQTAIGLGVLGDTALLLFKEKSTYYLSGSSPSDFVVRILDTNKGCVNESTIQETPIGVICLDRTGFVLFNKIGQGERISTDIQDVIDSILFPYSSSFYSWYDPKDQRYYCAVVIPGSQTPNLTLCLDLESMQWTTDTSLVGLSRLADTDSDGEYVELIGSKTNGRLVDLSNEEIPTFQDGAIYSSWTSGVLSFGDDQHKKKMRWLYLKVKAAGDWTVTIEIVPDFREDRKFTITVNYSSEQETWFASDGTGGTLYWDEGVWAFDGPEKSQVKIPIICKGRLFQVRIINQDTAANRWGFAIEGISAEAVMLDK